MVLISEKLPQKVPCQLYMQKADTEEWTVVKLWQLLGKHITALEIADHESYLPSVQIVLDNKPIATQREGHSNFHHKPTAGEMLPGNSKHNGNPNARSQTKYCYCSPTHWLDEC